MSLYSTLLIFHSYYRWLIVLLLFAQILWLAYHSYRQSDFGTTHLRLLILCTGLYDLQFIIGWSLYFQSTLAQQFWVAPANMVKIRDIRFFGIEHMTMMSLTILFINVITWRVRHKIGQKGVFANLLKWYILLATLILASIPWTFSPFTRRPDFR